jgi:hypothetical protein
MGPRPAQYQWRREKSCFHCFISEIPSAKMRKILIEWISFTIRKYRREWKLMMMMMIKRIFSAMWNITKYGIQLLCAELSLANFFVREMEFYASFVWARENWTNTILLLHVMHRKKILIFLSKKDVVHEITQKIEIHIIIKKRDERWW